MANPDSQRRCVFVGNIPYDATEEQLVQICEEVGPVVSFRLVTDRETGKPKGYGFCEYKDEETALSARRNLQGYEINGRQLRVDFAENDKNADKNREQGPLVDTPYAASFTNAIETSGSISHAAVSPFDNLIHGVTPMVDTIVILDKEVLNPLTKESVILDNVAKDPSSNAATFINEKDKSIPSNWNDTNCNKFGRNQI
ncbi:unnamed protein product [Cuscuta epithymum]|uniref:RRM domain-containing protein n=1 Tax=Cuscuta epithymum TaxID=186058 RepID=A0AAV0G4F9_9ASTE|nr:unnamed protein product [Cuscuta epithymum]